MKTYILNAGEKPPSCTRGKHDFVVIEKPAGNRSGWRKEECKHCKAVIEMDDSD